MNTDPTTEIAPPCSRCGGDPNIPGSVWRGEDEDSDTVCGNCITGEEAAEFAERLRSRAAELRAVEGDDE
jgi:hypothetical protein